jgi:hypothetical protein
MLAGLTPNGNNPQNNNPQTQTANADQKIQMFETVPSNQDANTQEITTEAEKQQAETDTPPPPPPPEPQPCEGVTCSGSQKGQLNGYAGGGYHTQDTPRSTGQPDVGVSEEETEEPPVVPVNHQYGTLANRDANEVSFTFNEDDNSGEGNDTFSARFRLHADDLESGEEKGGIQINFGDLEPPGPGDERRSSIHPATGALTAFARQDEITIYRDGTEVAPLVGEDGFAVLVNRQYFTDAENDGEVPGTDDHTNNFSAQPVPRGDVPSNVDLPEELCDDCDFMQWGVFGANAEFEDDNEEGDPVNREAHVLGFWVAGDIAAVGDLPFTGTATYNGTAVGTVNTDLFGTQQTYTARGDMNMDWNFASRSGTMEINNFDRQNFESSGGLNFEGKMCAPGVTSCGTSAKPWNTSSGNHFGGPLNQKLPENPETLPAGARDINGFANGSFARGPSNYDNGDPKTGTPIKGSTPQGVMGNWQVGNDHYQASGVFAGKRN